MGGGDDSPNQSPNFEEMDYLGTEQIIKKLYKILFLFLNIKNLYVLGIDKPHHFQC